MAINKKMKLVSNFGDEVVFDNTYIKVNSFYGDKNCFYFDTIIYNKDKTKELKNERFYFVPTMEDNFIKQAYLYLKSLPEYADAVDC